jgi:hypothetical protein
LCWVASTASCVQARNRRPPTFRLLTSSACQAAITSSPRSASLLPQLRANPSGQPLSRHTMPRNWKPLSSGITQALAVPRRVAPAEQHLTSEPTDENRAVTPQVRPQAPDDVHLNMTTSDKVAVVDVDKRCSENRP